MWKFSTPVFLEARNPSSGLNNTNSLPMVYDARGAPIYGPHHMAQLAFGDSAQHTTGGGSQRSITQSPLTECIWMFFWLFVLLFLSLPVALLAVQLHLLLQPLSACVSWARTANQLLFKLIRLPSMCAQNIIDAKALILI